VTLTTSHYSASDAATGAPDGNEISDVVDNTDGTSLLYTYNPTSTATLTASYYSASNATTGAPAGNEISDVVDNGDGTSIVYAYDPTSTVTLTASYYSASDATTGAPAGTLTSETFDYTSGVQFDSTNVGSSIATYNANGVSTQYYTGPDGTGSAVGSPVVSSGGSMFGGMAATQTGADASSAAADAASTTGASSQAAPGSTGETIEIAGSDRFIDLGVGNDTIAFAAGATSDTLLLHLGGSDLISGFDPSAGDTLDLSALLAEAGVNIGNDIAQLPNYVSVVNLNGSSAIVFDPTGQGGGSQVALLLDGAGMAAQPLTSKSFVI
jgi:hypothetical protein